MPITRAVVDSSPLLNLLALNFARVSEGPKHDLHRMITGDAQKYLFDDAYNQRKFLALFDSIERIIISSHIIGEINGLSQALKLDESSRALFWNHAAIYLRKRNLNEALIRLLDLNELMEDQKWIGIIGPTDTGLIRLASSERCLLLTDDQRTLHRRASEMGVRCELVRNLVADASL